MPEPSSTPRLREDGGSLSPDPRSMDFHQTIARGPDGDRIVTRVPLRDEWQDEDAQARPSGSAPSPRRIQLRRTKGWRKPAGVIVCSRPGRYGNPYRGPDAVEQFRAELTACIDDPYGAPHPIEIRNIAESIDDLRGHDLACWCGLDKECHVDVLIEAANR